MPFCLSACLDGFRVDGGFGYSVGKSKKDLADRLGIDASAYSRSGIVRCRDSKLKL